ncbi:MAG: glycosyltransferase [Chthoniobacteraceae bacterium]|nr:glycosyltransferase [Chthoniobacteraceae bacterium]
MTHKLSVVTPCYNAIRYIRNCVESVRYACKGMDYEHIVVDGLSSDGTVEYLREQSDIRLVSEKDSGMYDALNKGIAMARGEIIGHLNSDEQYSRRGLLAAWAALDDKNLDAVMSPTVMLNGRLEFMQLFNQVVRPTVRDVHWHMPVQSCSLLYRKVLWDREPYDTQYRLISDHVWFRKQMELGLRLAVSREPIGIFVWHGENLSSTQAQLEENALTDIDTKSFLMSLVKHWYRFRKLCLGGYCRVNLRYEIFGDAGLQSLRMFFPKLKVRKFDKTTVS